MIRFPLRRAVAASLLLLAACLPALAQSGSVTEQVAIAPAAPDTEFDTSYRASPVVSLRVQRRFLNDVRWAAGVEMRERLTKAFEERRPTEIWQDIVGQ